MATQARATAKRLQGADGKEPEQAQSDAKGADGKLGNLSAPASGARNKAVYSFMVIASGAAVGRARERTSWRTRCKPVTPKPARTGHSGLRLEWHPQKGRILVTVKALHAGEAVLREAPLNLCTVLPGYCFRCAAHFVESYTHPIRLRQGAQQCLRCQRFFCSQGCIHSQQHECECAVVAHIDSPLQGASEGSVYAARYSEAVCRLALLPLHAPDDVAQQVEQLDSSFPRAPFGEHRVEVQRALSGLLRALPAEVCGVPTTTERLWRLYGLIHTNTDVLDPPAAAPGQAKPPVTAFILRPLISLLAHACRPSCHLEDIGGFEARAGAAGATVLLKAAHDLPAGGELTRCYAGCLKDSAERFAACSLTQRREVLRSRGFLFECECDLCVVQRATPTA